MCTTAFTATVVKNASARELFKTCVPVHYERVTLPSAQGDIFRAITERQQTIKTLWAVPTPAFRRKAAEVKELEGRVTLSQPVGP